MARGEDCQYLQDQEEDDDDSEDVRYLSANPIGTTNRSTAAALALTDLHRNNDAITTKTPSRAQHSALQQQRSKQAGQEERSRTDPHPIPAVPAQQPKQPFTPKAPPLL